MDQSNRRERIAIAIVVLGIILGGLFLYFGERFYFGNYEWKIELEDCYQFTVKSWGYTEGGIYDTSEVGSILSMNGTLINVTIINLPSLNDIDSVESFNERVLEPLKISCMFANGSSVSSTISPIIIESISGCILPVGDWTVLDSYHEDAITNWVINGYYSVLYSDYFYLKHRWSSIDSARVWEGNISLVNGFPRFVHWSYAHYAAINMEFIIIE